MIFFYHGSYWLELIFTISLERAALLTTLFGAPSATRVLDSTSMETTSFKLILGGGDSPTLGQQGNIDNPTPFGFKTHPKEIRLEKQQSPKTKPLQGLHLITDECQHSAKNVLRPVYLARGIFMVDGKEFHFPWQGINFPPRTAHCKMARRCFGAL